MLTLALGLSVTSCMDEDWSDPTGDTAPYGNNDIQETNVISIADLKAQICINTGQPERYGAHNRRPADKGPRNRKRHWRKHL